MDWSCEITGENIPFSSLSRNGLVINHTLGLMKSGKSVSGEKKPSIFRRPSDIQGTVLYNPYYKVKNSPELVHLLFEV